MRESIAHIAKQLKEAREAKGLSQRGLSAKAGIPQSHISKIENGAVNLQLSSLIELSRVLGLELMLVPQKAAPAAKSVVKSATLDKYQLAEKRRENRRITTKVREELTKMELAEINEIERIRTERSSELLTPKYLRKYHFDEED